MVHIKACVLSHVLLFMTPWMVACQAPLSVGFSRQENWSELPFPPPGDLPRPGIEPSSPALAAGFFTTEPPGKLDCSLLGSSERHRPKGSDNGLHYLHPENVIETPVLFFCLKATPSPTKRAFMAKPVRKTWLFLVALEHNEAEEKRQAFGLLASPVANESSAASQDTRVLMSSACRIYGGIWR